MALHSVGGGSSGQAAILPKRSSRCPHFLNSRVFFWLRARQYFGCRAPPALSTSKSAFAVADAPRQVRRNQNPFAEMNNARTPRPRPTEPNSTTKDQARETTDGRVRLCRTLNRLTPRQTARLSSPKSLTLPGKPMQLFHNK